MAVTTTADGRAIVHVSKRKIPILGKHRKGIQASDLMTALTDPMEGLKQSPRVEKPRVLIETMRVVGDDIMTAHDNAIYEFLFANARENGIDKESHVIAVKNMMKFLEVRHVDRIVESLERITRTVVRYDIRDDEVRRRGSMPLILAELTEDLRSGTATLTYAIPAPIRRVVLAARDFAMLEIDAFAQFSSRYTGRLYPRLALMAGMDAPLRKPLEITPAKLAAELGFPLEKDGTLLYSSFLRRCLKPTMDDIETHVRRFTVNMKEVRGNGRGRPVEKLVFTTTSTSKRFEESKASSLNHRAVAAIRSTDDRHHVSELPGTLAIGKAVTRTGIDEFTLNAEWRDVLAQAKSDPSAILGGVAAGDLLQVLAKDGVGAAFAMWSETLKADVVEVSQSPVMPRQIEPVVVVDKPEYKQTVYPAFRRPPPPKPTVVDDPFDYVDAIPAGDRISVGDDCPF